MKSLKIALAQVNPTVGDIDGNTDLVLRAIAAAERAGAEAVVFPELVLCGYPPEDLLLRSSMGHRIERALARLKSAVTELYIIVGYPRVTSKGVFNAAGVIFGGELIHEYHKCKLPNYRVFDEKRYFQVGATDAGFMLGNVRVGLSICEDIWHPEPIAQAAADGAALMININASPFRIGKQNVRETNAISRTTETGIPILSVNLAGAQDELVFDGQSFVMNAAGEVCLRCVDNESELAIAEFERSGQVLQPVAAAVAPIKPRESSVYSALVSGLHDYIVKNGFPGVILGLSGGIDSALTLAIAVDALGADKVRAVMMPYRYTSSMSLEDAQEQATTLGVDYQVISIESIYEQFMGALGPVFEGLAADTTEENLQARCRGVLLMAMSNKFGSLVITTGNKSELAVGYATLYGDMAGGFDVLKDVSKTLVYALSRYRNTISEVIPERVITRPPSAELAPDQVDQDSLPEYDVLDDILHRYVELDDSAEAIIEAGFDKETVHRVVRLIDINEYKRRQGAIGPRITQRGFGRDRRYPITNRWPAGD